MISVLSIYLLCDTQKICSVPFRRFISQKRCYTARRWHKDLMYDRGGIYAHCSVTKLSSLISYFLSAALSGHSEKLAVPPPFFLRSIVLA